MCTDERCRHAYTCDCDEQCAPPMTIEEMDAAMAAPAVKQTYRIRYIEPDVNPWDDTGASVIGDCTRIVFFEDDEEIDQLDFDNGQEVVEEIEFWEEDN